MARIISIKRGRILKPNIDTYYLITLKDDNGYKSPKLIILSII